MKIADKIITILCEDLRQELGGKFSLMGVYNYGIVVPEVPAKLERLVFAIILTGVKKKFTDFKIKIIPPNAQIIEQKYPAQPGMLEEKNINLFLSFSPFVMENLGNYKIEVYFGEESKPSIVHEFPVVKASTK